MPYTDIQTFPQDYGDTTEHPWRYGLWTMPKASGNILPNAPSFLVVHGGGWAAGSFNDVHVVRYCWALAKLGYHCFAIDYRLLIPEDEDTTEPVIETMMEDLRLAYDHMAQTVCCDADRISVLGNSAGGHLAYLLGCEADPGKPLLAMVGVEPVLDLFPWAEVDPKRMCALLGKNHSDPELIAYSPKFTTEEGMAPPLTICGEYWMALTPQHAAEFMVDCHGLGVDAGWVDLGEECGHVFLNHAHRVAELADSFVSHQIDGE